MRKGSERKASGAALFFAGALLLAQAAAGAGIDLGKVAEGEPVPVRISRGAANRIEFPETVVSAFSSSASIDVKIIGRTALVRTEEPAELIALTEKRRLTLLLEPEDVPSRTVVLRADAENAEDAGGGGQAEAAGKHLRAPLPREAAITYLVSVLASRPAAGPPGKERPLPGGLYASRIGDASSGSFSASAFLVRNGGKKEVLLRESAFSADPATAAVGLERTRLSPGESCRVFVVAERGMRRDR